MKKFDDSDDWSEYKKVDKKKTKPRKEEDKWNANSKSHIFDDMVKQDVFHRKQNKWRY